MTTQLTGFGLTFPSTDAKIPVKEVKPAEPETPRTLLEEIDFREKQLSAKLVENGVEDEAIEMNRYALGPWSYSKMKVLERCPYQFYLKYVLKVKHTPVVEDRLKANVGTTAHRILEEIIKGKGIEAAFKHVKTENAQKTKLLTDAQWVEHIVPLEYNIIQFKERMELFEKNNKIKRMMVELRVAVNKNWEPTGFFSDDVYIRGVIDLVAQIDVGGSQQDLLIIDHKHGGGEANTTRNYDTQLNSYKPLFHFGIEPIRGAQSSVHFIQAGKIVHGPYHAGEEVSKKLRKDLEWLIDGAIDTAHSKGFFKHVAGSYCQWCDYKIECKDKKLKDHELTTKRRMRTIPILPI